MKATVYSHIASLLIAIDNCAKSKNIEWKNRHTDSIENLVKSVMPSGSGIDNGTKFDFDSSNPNKLVFTFSYHHMNEGGYYTNWTDHKAIVTPSLAFGFIFQITGPNKNDIKYYLCDLFHSALSAQFEQVGDDWKYSE